MSSISEIQPIIPDPHWAAIVRTVDGACPETAERLAHLAPESRTLCTAAQDLIALLDASNTGPGSLSDYLDKLIDPEFTELTDAAYQAQQIALFYYCSLYPTALSEVGFDLVGLPQLPGALTCHATVMDYYATLSVTLDALDEISDQAAPFAAKLSGALSDAPTYGETVDLLALTLTAVGEMLDSLRHGQVLSA